MKILYISLGKGPDYLCDVIFHRLRSLLSINVVDVNCLEYLCERRR